jgi:hypothetical protein
MLAGKNEEQTEPHRKSETQTEQESDMTTQGKQATNNVPPHATQPETLQCGTSAEACGEPRNQLEPVRAVWRQATAESMRDR